MANLLLDQSLNSISWKHIYVYAQKFILQIKFVQFYDLSTKTQKLRSAATLDVQRFLFAARKLQITHGIPHKNMRAC